MTTRTFSIPITLYRPGPEGCMLELKAGFLSPIEDLPISQIQYWDDGLLRQPLAQHCPECRCYFLAKDYPGGCPKCMQAGPHESH